MKRFFYTIMLSLLCTGGAYADDISLAWCDGSQVEGSLGVSGEVAAVFSAAHFPMYAGTQLTGVRIGMNEDVPKGVTIFIRSSLTGENLYTFSTGLLYKGWNDLTFDQSVTFPEEGLVIGYTANNTSMAGISGQAYTDGCYAKTNGSWLSYATAVSHSLCIEPIISGESYTKNDVELISSDDLTVEAGKPFSVSGLLRNNTNTILSAVTLAYNTGAGEKTADATVNDVLPGEIGAFTLPIEDGVSATGDCPLTLSVASINGVADDYAFNDTAACTLSVLDDIVKKKVLIENFTTEKCSNCPSGHERLESGLKGETDYVLIAHHSGFYTDEFTTTGDVDLLWFYNSTTKYAPALMINRHKFAENNSAKYNKGPVFSVPDAEAINKFYKQQLEGAAPVKIELQRNFNPDTRKLVIKATMKQIAGIEMGDNPTLTINLIEDGLEGEQYGATGTYTHNDVTRLFVTPSLGDVVKLSTDEETSATYTTTVNGAWKEKNMRIVAFVSNYDSSDPNNCDVYNATECELIGSDDILDDVPDGISSTSADLHSAQPEAIYTLTGERISKMQKGVNLVRFSDGTVRKVLVK